MGKIVAIGGGENGRPGYKYETEFLDKEIIHLSNKKVPNFLFVGLASKYPNSYYDESNFRIISSIKNAKAIKCYWSKGKYITEMLKQNIYQEIEILYNKDHCATSAAETIFPSRV